MAKFSKDEKILIEELRACKQKMDDKTMIYGLWSCIDATGSQPDSREGATTCTINNSLYLFGGFSRDIFNDMRVLDLNVGRWRLIMSNDKKQKKPAERFAHTMVQYNDKLVVFGGAGTYISSIKMRLSYNDLFIFDTQTECWLPECDIEGAPRKRMNHGCSIMGCLMLVHGGFNTEQKKALDEMKCFDLEIMKWVDTRVYFEGNRIDDIIPGTTLPKKYSGIQSREEGWELGIGQR